MWISPRRNVPVVSTTAPHKRSSDHPPSTTPHTRPSVDEQVLDRPLDHVEAVLRRDLPLHRRTVELAIRLRPRPLHCRPARPIEQPELNPRRIRDPAHQPVERIDLAHEMALAEPPDRRIARHLADRREAGV